MDRSFACIVLALLCYVAQCAAETRLLLTSIKKLEFVDADRSGSNGSVIISRLRNAYAVDYLYADESIYWADFDLNTINRLDLNDTANPTTIVRDGIDDVTGLAVDWISRKLYWADRGKTHIEVSTLDGQLRKVVFDKLDHLWALTIDPVHGYLYWTQWGWSGRIERGGMNGDERTKSVIVDKGIRWAYGLALDPAASTIYWTDIAVNDLQSCNFDGKNRRHIEQGVSGLAYPYGVTVDRKLVYWTDASSRSIYACNKFTFKDCFFVYTTARPWDIKAYGAFRQPPGNNACANNGGCSELCLLSPVLPYYTCACSNDSVLLSDGKSCGKVPKKPATPYIQSNIGSTDADYVIGKSYTLSCRSEDEGKLGIEFRFIKNGIPKQIIAENYYVIYRADTDDSGEYQCQTVLDGVQSGVSNVLTVEVTIPATIVATPTLLSDISSICRMPVQDQKYTLTCTTNTVVEGLLYSFIKDGVVLKSSSENAYSIDYASRADNGRYECKAFTSTGESERSNVVEFHVVEQHLRATAKPGTISRNSSEPLVIKCIFDHRTCASNSVELVSLTLSKASQVGSNNLIDLASVSARNPDQVQTKTGSSARFHGKINDGAVSVLEAVENNPTSAHAGSYTCLASLRSSDGEAMIMTEHAQVLGDSSECANMCTETVPVLQQQVSQLQMQMGHAMNLIMGMKDHFDKFNRMFEGQMRTLQTEMQQNIEQQISELQKMQRQQMYGSDSHNAKPMSGDGMMVSPTPVNSA